MGLLFIYAVTPSILLMIYILKFDKYQREPTSLLIKLFIFGALCVIPVLPLEIFAQDLIDSAFPRYFQSTAKTLVEAFLGVALIEEGAKFIVAKILSYRHRAYDCIYDGIIYCVMVSLGFATIENIMYVFNYGIVNAYLRAITAVPAHTVFGLCMGYFMSLGKFGNKNKGLYRILSLLLPVIIHGVYDAILFLDLDYGLLIFVPFVVLMYTKSIKLIKSVADIPPIVENTTDNKPTAIVVAALIWMGGRFMICQRPAHKQRGMLWEFIGGKVENGESLQDALIRECREEADIIINVGSVFMDLYHEYPDINIRLVLFNASIAYGIPKAIEHNDIKFILPSEIDNFEFCPADVEILKKIKNMYC